MMEKTKVCSRRELMRFSALTTLYMLCACSRKKKLKLQIKMCYWPFNYDEAFLRIYKDTGKSSYLYDLDPIYEETISLDDFRKNGFWEYERWLVPGNYIIHLDCTRTGDTSGLSPVAFEMRENRNVIFKCGQ